jgi:hypothetical protein
MLSLFSSFFLSRRKPEAVETEPLCTAPTCKQAVTLADRRTALVTCHYIGGFVI